jgi:hypothetical protein
MTTMKGPFFQTCIALFILELFCSPTHLPALTEAAPLLEGGNFSAASIQCDTPEPPFVTGLEVRQAPTLAEPAPRLPLRDPVWTRYEGSPSRDGRWWGLMAEDPDYLTSALLVYDLTTDKVTATLDTRG